MRRFGLEMAFVTFLALGSIVSMRLFTELTKVKPCHDYGSCMAKGDEWYKKAYEDKSSSKQVEMEIASNYFRDADRYLDRDRLFDRASGKLIRRGG